MPSSIRSAHKAIPPPNPGQAVVPPSAVVNQAQLHDRYIRGVYPLDAIEAAVRQEFIDRRARRDPFVSQEFVASVNTGGELDAEKWRDRRARKDRLQQQAEGLVMNVENTGVPMRRSANVWVVGLITGARELLNEYRPVCFLPTVAQRERQAMLNELRLYRRMYYEQRKWMRFGVVTAGDSIPLLGLPPAEQSSDPTKTREYFALRDRISELSRSVSRFAQWANQVHDVDVVFRGTEFTVKQRDGDDFLSAHVHANVLYTPNRLLNKTEWRAFLVGAKAHFGNWWQDCGKLKKPDEALKYPFKPVELEGLEDAQVRYLFEQTFGLPMMQPLGSFRTWRKDTFWTVEVDADGIARRRKYRRVVTVKYPNGAELDICSVRKRIGKRGAPRKVVREDQPSKENVLLGITMPQERFCPWAEPCAMVLNYTEQPVTAFGQDTLDGLEAERRLVLPVWYMNGAPDPEAALTVGRAWAAARDGDAGNVVPFSVHTDRTTAGSGGCRGPPIPIRATAADEWQQLGVDFSVDLSVFEDVATATAG